MLTSLLGPDFLNVLPAESDIMTLFTFVGDAAFYFFPCIVGYTAAQKFGVTPVLGILMGAILIHPTFVDTSFTLGIKAAALWAHAARETSRDA